jgi:protein-tyrosine phosphatase
MGAPPKNPVRALFICQFNRRRSATAERVLAKDPTLEVRSAGTSAEAAVRVNERMLDWADVVFVMEEDQVRDLRRLFPAHPAIARLVCLEIRDVYHFLDPQLVTLLQERSRPHLDRLRGTS